MATAKEGVEIEITAAVYPFDGVTCHTCRCGIREEAPGYKVRIGHIRVLVCYGCLECLSKLCRVFVFSSRPRS